jgi:hypothetical protein
VRGDALGGRTFGGEQLGGRGVAGRALAGKQVLVDRGAHDRMDERRRLRRCEHLGFHKPVHGLSRLAVVEAARLCREPQVRVAEHGECPRERRRRGSEPLEPVEHEAADRRRPHPRDACRGLGRRLDLSLFDRRDQLAQEQRIAARGAVAGAAELVVRLAERSAHEVGRRLLAQRPQAQRQPRTALGELTPERARRFGIGNAARHGQQDRDAFQASGHVAEEAQRRRIGPVGVVDGEHQRAAVGEVRGQPVEAVERPEGRVSPLGLERRARVAEQALAEAGRAREERRALLPARRQHGRLEQLARHAEGELALERGAACLEHSQPRALGLPPRAREQAALADPRRPLDEHHASAALACPLDSVAELAKLVVALQQLGSRGRASPHLPRRERRGTEGRAQTPGERLG